MEKNEIKVHVKSKHLGSDERFTINKMLNDNYTPSAIENMGYTATNVFYCDAMQSQQKGKIKKNHEELRKMFPKGLDFRKITQADLNYALNLWKFYKLINVCSFVIYLEQL